MEAVLCRLGKSEPFQRLFRVRSEHKNVFNPHVCIVNHAFRRRATNLIYEKLFNAYQSEVDYLHIKFYFVFYSICLLVGLPASHDDN